MADDIARKKIREMLAEDLGTGDVTSVSLFGPEVKARAEVIAKKGGVLAGVAEAAMVFKEAGAKVEIVRTDGSNISTGEVVMRLSGKATEILAAERVALNLLMRMSGIATATRELIIKARRKNPKVIIAATRKTPPLISYFDKQAVKAAGGSPHRYHLSDQVLIKDNHLKLIGSITEAVNRVRKSGAMGKIEVEVTSPEEAMEAAKAGADIIMLDNMTPSEDKRAIKMLEREGLRDRVSLEASGGIDPSNVGDYAAAGVDVISSSYMTMRAQAIDMSLEIVRGDKSKRA